MITTLLFSDIVYQQCYSNAVTGEGEKTYISIDLYLYLYIFIVYKQ